MPTLGLWVADQATRRDQTKNGQRGALQNLSAIRGFDRTQLADRRSPQGRELVRSVAVQSLSGLTQASLVENSASKPSQPDRDRQHHDEQQHRGAQTAGASLHNSMPCRQRLDGILGILEPTAGSLLIAAIFFPAAMSFRTCSSRSSTAASTARPPPSLQPIRSPF